MEERKVLSSSLLFFGAIVLLGFLFFRFSVNAKELRNYEYAKGTTMELQEISKEYHFSAQIQRTANGERGTEFVPFGVWDNEEKAQAEILGEFVITRITGNGKKGTIGAWYYNVGTYQGKEVDLKCTVADYMQKAGPNDTTGANLGWIAMSAEQLGIYVRNLRWVELQMEFYDAKSGNPLSLQSTAVLTDIDEGEGMMLLSEYESFGTSKESKLRILDLQEKQMIVYDPEQTSAEDEAKDSWAQVQILLQGAQFRYRMYSKLGMEQLLKTHLSEEELNVYASDEAIEENMMQEDSSFKAGTQMENNSQIEDGDVGSDGLEAPEFMLHFQGYSDCRLTPLATGDGELTVQDSDESGKEKVMLYHREEDFVYEMSYMVSPEYKNWYYDSFTVCAQLPDELAFFSGEVYTEDGNRVSDQFFIRESDGKVCFEAKKVTQDSFYGKTYEFAINGNVNEEAELEAVWNGSMYTLPLVMQIIIERNGKREETWSNEAYINLSDEYIDGRAQVILKDVLSGAVLTDGEIALWEWNKEHQAYEEVRRTQYEKAKDCYALEGLTKNHKNQGKYKVSVSQLPKHYLGRWEQEIEIQKNQAVFEVTGEHQPTGKTLIRMTSKVIRVVDGQELISEEYDSYDNAVAVCSGDKIQYHVYVGRDSALTYKSGELLIKNKIPDGLHYDKETLNLIGEIQHPVEHSTAKIASVLLNKEGELIWKINHLDEGEIAHVIFEVTVPKEDLAEDGKRYVDYAKLIENDQTIASNVLEHQVKISLNEDSLDEESNDVLTEEIQKNPPDDDAKDAGKQEHQSGEETAKPVIKPEEVLADSKNEMEESTSKDRGQNNQQEAAKTGDTSKAAVYWLMAGGAVFVFILGRYLHKYIRKRKKLLVRKWIVPYNKKRCKKV